MRRQLLVNGGLLALALSTLGVVWLTRDAPTTTQLEARKNKLFSSWDKHAVTQLRLKRGEREVRLQRDTSAGVEGDFRIVAPWQERADIGSVNALLGSLDLASFLRSADGIDRARAGLSPPQLELTLELAGKLHVLRLGGPAPAPAGARYLEVSHGEAPAHVVVVSAGVVAELDVPLDKLRDPRLLELTRSDTARLTITHVIGRAELVQERQKTAYSSALATFVQREGRRELADRDVVARLFTALSRLVTTRFVEPELARGALARDERAVTIVLERMAKQGPPITLRLGGACPEAADQQLVLREEAEQQPRAGCMASDVVDALRVVEGQLVLTTPFAARVDEVQELRVSSSSAESLPARSPDKLELARKEDGFVMRSPSEATIPLDAGNQRLSDIVRARAERPTRASAEPGFADGFGWVAVQLAKSDADPFDSERVRLGRPRPDGSRCLTREADGVVLCLDAAAAKAFQPDATLLRSTALTSFAVSEVLGLELRGSALEQSVERREDGSYVLKEPKGYGHDGSLVTDVLQALGSLRAERWVAPRAQPEHGLERPRLRARVTLREAAPLELVVGAATRGGYFAQLAQDPAVFVLSRASVVDLEAPLIDRTLLPLTAENIASVELQGGARRVRLTRRGDAFAGDGLTPDRAAELVEALRGLRADFTVHLGPARAHEGLTPARLTISVTSSKGERHVLHLGARDTIDGATIAYARVAAVDATFALAASTAGALQDY